MTAEPAVNTSGAARPSDRPAVELRHYLAGTLVGLLAAAAVLVGWRRLAGALKTPLEPPVLLLAGALAAAMAIAARLVWHHVAAVPKASRLDWSVAILPTTAVLGLGAALTLRDTDTGALIAFWTLLAVEEVWAWLPAAWRRLHRGRKPVCPTRALRVDPPQASAPHPPPTEASATIPPDEVLQQLTRSQAADGSECLSGWLRTVFSPGQRTASVHVAFCPPFAKTPELAVEKLDGPPLRIKMAKVWPYGTQLDLKLAATAEQPLSVLLQFSARTAGPSGRSTGVN